jgi:hypothetical protein
MADNRAKKELLKLLDEKAFDPVLKASPDDYQKEEDKQKLKELQEKTSSTKRRYHEEYNSVDAIRSNFSSDLSSDSAEKVQKQIADLGLPTLSDIKDEFHQKVKELGAG